MKIQFLILLFLLLLNSCVTEQKTDNINVILNDSIIINNYSLDLSNKTDEIQKIMQHFSKKLEGNYSAVELLEQEKTTIIVSHHSNDCSIFMEKIWIVENTKKETIKPKIIPLTIPEEGIVSSQEPSMSKLSKVLLSEYFYQNKNTSVTKSKTITKYMLGILRDFAYTIQNSDNYENGFCRITMYKKALKKILDEEQFDFKLSDEMLLFLFKSQRFDFLNNKEETLILSDFQLSMKKIQFKNHTNLQEVISNEIYRMMVNLVETMNVSAVETRGLINDYLQL